MTPEQVLADPEFWAIPSPQERAKVLRDLDPDFAAMPEPEQMKVVTRGRVTQRDIERGTGVPSSFPTSPGGFIDRAVNILSLPADLVRGRLFGAPGERVTGHELLERSPSGKKLDEMNENLSQRFGDVVGPAITTAVRLPAELATSIVPDPISYLPIGVHPRSRPAAKSAAPHAAEPAVETGSVKFFPFDQPPQVTMADAARTKLDQQLETARNLAASPEYQGYIHASRAYQKDETLVRQRLMEADPALRERVMSRDEKVAAKAEKQLQKMVEKRLGPGPKPPELPTAPSASVYGKEIEKYRGYTNPYEPAHETKPTFAPSEQELVADYYKYRKPVEQPPGADIYPPYEIPGEHVFVREHRRTEAVFNAFVKTKQPDDRFKDILPSWLTKLDGDALNSWGKSWKERAHTFLDTEARELGIDRSARLMLEGPQTSDITVEMLRNQHEKFLKFPEFLADAELKIARTVRADKSAADLWLEKNPSIQNMPRRGVVAVPSEHAEEYGALWREKEALKAELNSASNLAGGAGRGENTIRAGMAVLDNKMSEILTRRARIAAAEKEAVKVAEQQAKGVPTNPTELLDIPAGLRPRGATALGEGLTMSGTQLAREFSPTGRQFADIVDVGIYDRLKRDVSGALAEFHAVLDSAYGRRSLLSPKRISLASDYNTTAKWNISRDEHDYIVNMLHSEGRIQPRNWKEQAVADAWDNIHRRFSGRPEIQGTHGFDGVQIRVGEGAWKKVGAPSRHYPHIPAERNLRQLLRKYNTEIVDTRNYIAKNDPANLDIWTAALQKERGLQLADDVAAQELRKRGYEVDLNRTLFQSISAIGARANRENVKGMLDSLLPRLRMEATAAELGQPMSGFVDQAGKLLPSAKPIPTWVDVLYRRAMGEELYDPKTPFGQWMGDTGLTARKYLTATKLQLAAIPQWNQLPFVIAEAGFKTTGAALRNIVKDPAASQAFVERSGALYNSYRIRMASPTSALDIYAANKLRLHGVPTAAAATRSLAAHTGPLYAQKVALKLVRAPAMSKDAVIARGQLEELRLNPDEIMRRGGKLTEEEQLHAAQVFADHSTGSTDLSGLPLLWNTEHDVAKSLILFRQFMLTNTAELHRLMNGRDITQLQKFFDRFSVRAGKVGRFALAGAVTGEATMDTMYAATHLDNPFSDERVSKGATKMFGATGGRMVENYMAVLGSTQAALMYSLINGREDIAMDALQLIGGSVAKFAVDAAEGPVRDVRELFRDASEGTLPERPGQHTLDWFTREFFRDEPVAGPVWGRMERERQRARKKAERELSR